MPIPILVGLTALTMLAFAGNSILCRLALSATDIDPASFTSIRLFTGALVLCLLVGFQRRALPKQGSIGSAIALFVYAAAFSYSYTDLTTATGALLLFGAVQVTMIGYGFFKGESFVSWQWIGLLVALMGLVGLLLPGLESPPLVASLIMIFSGIAWGAYSIRGQGAGDALAMTAGNFVGAAVIALVFSAVLLSSAEFDVRGVIYAALSGGVTSALGYALWYSVLPYLRSTQAASIQLTVPVITAIGGLVFVAEPIGWRLILASIAILGGIALVIFPKSSPQPKNA